MARILLTGASGGLGAYLTPRLAQLNDVFGVSRNNTKSNFINLDLENEAALKNILNTIDPQIIIHAAAITDIDFSEKNPQKTYSVNVNATKFIVQWIKQRNPKTKLIYISTDQVYGTLNSPHSEHNECPVNFYGWSKLWAEDIVRLVEHSLVLRLNYVGLGSVGKKSLLGWIYQSFMGSEPFTLFNDINFNPISGNQAGEIIGNLVERGIMGTYNLGADCEGISKAEFALLVAKSVGLKSKHVKVGSSQEYKYKAKRPLSTTMNVEKLKQIIDLPNMHNVIDSVSAELMELKQR